jgi:hypothetical protein
MRIILLAVALIAIRHVTGFSQVTPFHRFPLYIQDAHGNRDTLLIGWDPDAETELADNQFGEYVDDSPFDTVLDVRGVLKYWPATVTTKNYVGFAEPDQGYPGCYVEGGIRILIHAKYLPIHIEWEQPKSLACPLDWDYVLSPDDRIVLVWPWWVASPFWCLADGYSATWDGTVGTPQFPQTLELKEVPALGNTTVEAVEFWFKSYSEGYCASVAAQNLPLEEPLVYPNPTNGKLYFSSSKAEQISIFHASGSLVAEATAQEIDLSHLSSGLYQVVFGDRAHRQVHQVLKL